MKILRDKVNLAWFLVILGGIVELFWVSGLKYADNALWYVLTICGIAFSFVCMLIAVRHIEVSVAYAVFVGIGAAGGVLVGILFYKESKKPLKIFFIILIIASAVGLKALA